MASVKYAISAYVADGTTTDYLITWDYLDEDHIAVYVDGTSNADPTASHTFSKLNDTTLRITDELGNAIAAGAEIEIRRETPLTTRAITFADGSALLASDLNKNSDYLLYSMQEVLDTVDAAAQDGALAAQTRSEEILAETTTLKNTTAGYLATVQSDATDADNHRIAAAASEAASAASEAAAATSESNAATSATNSANSATASANSASASAASAAASLASEQAAAASETAAAASETAAAASANSASIDAITAGNWAASANLKYDQFDDRYLGAKTTAPTVDNDGAALLTGALYWNSTSDEMYVWNGTAWDTFNSTQGIADGATSAKLNISDTLLDINVDTQVDANLTVNGSIVSTNGNSVLLQETAYIHKQFPNDTDTTILTGDQSYYDPFIDYRASSGTPDRGWRFGGYDNNGNKFTNWSTLNGRFGVSTDNPTSQLTVGGGQTLSLGERASAGPSGRSVQLEGVASAVQGEAAGRIMFTEHNSTDANADNYGLSINYDGIGNAVWPSGFAPNMGNATWDIRRHDGAREGNQIMYGYRSNNNVHTTGDLRGGQNVYSEGGGIYLQGASVLRPYSNMTLDTSATDVYIASQNLITTGTYVLTVLASGGGWYTERWSGIMQWYAAGTNSNESENIYMTGMGHAPNSGEIYARVQRKGGNAMNQSVQIWSNLSRVCSVEVFARRIN